MNIQSFVFNDFYENTYVLYDETKQCAIIDPGCNTPNEEKQLTDFIEKQQLKPVLLLNTHCHIDHILGNKFVADTYNLKLTSHKGEMIMLQNQQTVAHMYNIRLQSSPDIEIFVDEGDVIKFGNTSLEVLFTPGHSPASICFYHKAGGTLIGGDVLFKESIGRTDLPGGNHDLLINNILTKLMPLPDATVVYCGHGPSTTIGHERQHNPFF